MDKGKIVEKGSHDQLLRDLPEGIYAQMVANYDYGNNDDDQNEAVDTIQPGLPVSINIDTKQLNLNLPKVQTSDVIDSKPVRQGTG